VAGKPATGAGKYIVLGLVSDWVLVC
jgi:hypothetical protein